MIQSMARECANHITTDFKKFVFLRVDGGT